jgi:DNA helicase IV
MSERAEIAEEQSYLDHAYACLERMRAHAEDLLARADSPNQVEAEILRWHFQERVTSLGDARTPLIFGRLDEELGDSFRIGRRHVRDEKGDAMVVDWRARVAAPFYRATIQDPMGLKRRRRYVIENRKLIDLFDEYLDDPDSVLATSHGGVPDPLLAEIGRARTGQMRDIVATIQAEQDVIIRKPLGQMVIVQGGPGTGKTAVGLHRAAFLLYEHRELLERTKVLIVGPNRLFLSYISQVLPSLGETAAYQTTITALAGSAFRARKTDPADVARLKGDVRMATVIRRAYTLKIEAPTEDIRVAVSGFVFELPATVIRKLIVHAEAEHSLRQARSRFISNARNYLLERYELDIVSAGPEPEEVIDTALRKGDLEKQLAKVWPNTGPEALVRKLLTSRVALQEAAVPDDSDKHSAGDGSGDGVRSHDTWPSTSERQTLQYRSTKDLREGGWSSSDIALLDEAVWLIEGVESRYGHSIVDEAQDLSAMELRMIARRTRSHSMTILGDLAQATTPAGQSSWEEVLGHLGAPRSAELDELSIGYRVPESIMDLANRLLPLAAPGVRPSRSVRPSAEGPRLLRSFDGSLLEDVEQELRALTKLWQSIGVICPELLMEQLIKTLKASELRFATWEKETIDEPIILLPPVASKGLEFDAVLVIEPELIMQEPKGARRLYVALTRAVQHLSIVHEMDLPALLLSDQSLPDQP